MIFLGEHLTYINCIGLVVLVLGVALFNYTKYKKVVTGQAVGTRPPVDYEKGELRAERHEAHNSERALLVGGRRINLGGTSWPVRGCRHGFMHLSSMRCTSAMPVTALSAQCHVSLHALEPRQQCGVP